MVKVLLFNKKIDVPKEVIPDLLRIGSMALMTPHCKNKPALAAWLARVKEESAAAKARRDAEWKAQHPFGDLID